MPWRIKFSDNGLLRQLTGTTGVQGLGVGSLFFAHIAMAQFAGPESYGKFVYLFAWINLAAVIGKFGVDRALVRYVSKAPIATRVKTARALLGWGWSTVFCLSVIVLVFLALLFWVIEGVADREMLMTALIGGLVLFLVNFTFVQKGAILGLGSPIRSKIPTELFRPPMLLLIVFSVWSLGYTTTAPVLMAGTFLSFLFTLLLGQQLFESRLRELGSPAEETSTSQIRPSLNELKNFAVISASSTIFKYTDVILVGALTGPTEVAYYSVATRVASVTLFFQRAASAVMQPRISSDYQIGRVERLASSLASSTSVVIGLTTIAVMLTLFMGKDLLSMFGFEFRQGYVVLVLLLAGQVCSVLCGPSNAVLSMTGNEDTAAAAQLIAVGMNLIGNIALVSSYGATGAAVATAFSIFIWNSLLVFKCRRLVKIDPSLVGVISFYREQRKYGR